MTHIAQQRALFAKNRKYIQQLLQWDDLTYTTFQFESGIIYLQESLSLMQFEYEMLSQDEMFWAWWMNEWNLIDAQIVPVLQNNTNGNPLKKYVNKHTMAMVDRTPNNLILEESYAKFIGQYNDKHNNSHATK